MFLQSLLGRITKSVDADGNTRSTTYNATNGFAASATSALGTPQSFTYSTEGNDNLKTVQEGATGGAGTTTESYAYGAASPNQYLATSSTDAQGNATTTGYSSSGEPQTITDTLSSQNQAVISYNTNGTVKTSVPRTRRQVTRGRTRPTTTTPTAT